MWYNYIYLFLIPFINIKSWQNYIFNVLQLNLHIKRLHNKTFFYCCFCWSLFTIIIKPQTILIIENNPSIFTFSFRNLSRFKAKKLKGISLTHLITFHNCENKQNYLNVFKRIRPPVNLPSLVILRIILVTPLIL